MTRIDLKDLLNHYTDKALWGKKWSVYDYGDISVTAELEKAGHSGMSHSITLKILKRLLDGKPITPITEDDFKGAKESILKTDDGAKSYQCPRYPSLFKWVHADGNVSYSEVGRTVCFNIENTGDWWEGCGSSIVDEMFPIKMPYSPPDGKYEVAIEHASHDKALGFSDMFKVVCIIEPDGKKVDVNRCYKETIAGWRRFGENGRPSAVTGGFKEITFEEYERLKASPRIESEWKEGEPIETIEVKLESADCCCGG